MSLKYPVLLKSKSNLSLFRERVGGRNLLPPISRKSRSDRGRKRRRYLSLGRKKNKSLVRSIAEAAAVPIAAELLVAGTPVLLGKLRNKNTSIGSANYIPTDNDSKIKIGLQYISQGSGLGKSPSIDSIGGRLSMIKNRVQRGANTYQDLSRLPVSRIKKLKAGAGITAQVGQDIWKDLNKSVTLKKRR